MPELSEKVSAGARSLGPRGPAVETGPLTSPEPTPTGLPEGKLGNIVGAIGTDGGTAAVASGETIVWRWSSSPRSPLVSVGSAVKTR